VAAFDVKVGDEVTVLSNGKPEGIERVVGITPSGLIDTTSASAKDGRRRWAANGNARAKGRYFFRIAPTTPEHRRAIRMRQIRALAAELCHSDTVQVQIQGMPLSRLDVVVGLLEEAKKVVDECR